MKIFLAVLLAAFCYVSADVTSDEIEKVHEIMKDCKAEHAITDEDIGLLMQHKVPESQVGKCFAACVNKKMGLLDADNKVDMARVTEIMGKLKEKLGDNYDPLVKIFQTCADENKEGGADECEVSAKLMECNFRETKAINLKVDLMKLVAS